MKSKIKKKTSATQKASSPLDFSTIKKQIEKQLKSGRITQKQVPYLQQREPLKQHLASEKSRKKVVPHNGDWVQTGIEGFDELLQKGIPNGASILVCGGPGSGKTIFCLQTLAHAVAQGEKCLYMTFEEAPERLVEHMADFGWDAEKMIKDGNLLIKKYNPYDITRQVEAMMEKAKGELLIDVKPLLFPEGFTPDRIVVDSLSAIAAGFVGKEDVYRVYIEQLFALLETVSATSFLISETTELPRKLSFSGIEEFMADGVILIYNIKHGNVRESAIECLKLRGAGFQKKIVAMQIIEGKGIEVYPEQEVFSDVE